MSNELWSNDPTQRLAAARALPQSELDAIIETLLPNGKPNPYGCTTQINPAVLTMGLAPASDVLYEQYKDTFENPTAGKPHPHYIDRRQDDADFWEPMVTLAENILMPAGIAQKDVTSLFGNVNLSAKPMGRKELANTDFVECLLKTICEHLRPNILVLIGLRGYIKKHAAIAHLFSQTFGGMDINRPDAEYPFQAWTEQNYTFCQWDVKGKDDNSIKIVSWPQAPSRAPMTNRELWQASCDEFLAKNPNLFR